MPIISCYECRKKYDYTEDGFCPRCGSFNQPRKGSYIVSASGDIVRTDGINEAGHENSFVHAEYHAEERSRKRLGLDRDTAEAGSSRRSTVSNKKKANPISFVFLLIWLAALLLIIFPTIFSLL
ncbi:MAG: hypothetical protein E7445_02810 [Ruminococcaceae bacterium]|nr:hypothetical protein [Oscillospiraceae bacterium]